MSTYLKITSEYWKQVHTKPIIPVLNHNELNDFGIKRWENIKQKKWIRYQDHLEVMSLLVKYFTKDKTFENADRSLKKGLLLVGGIGTGKTTLMALYARNQLNS